MAVLTVQDGSVGIQSVTMAAATGGGDSAAGGVRVGGWELPVILLVSNASAGAITVTVDGVGYIVPITTGLAAIPLRGGVAYGQSKAITYSGVTSLTVGVVRLHAAL
jgi:hypothetical protein